MSLALSLLSEVQTACTMGCGTMGFAFLTASLGTIPLFQSLLHLLHIPPYGLHPPSGGWLSTAY
jgi:hypothetical protein